MRKLVKRPSPAMVVAMIALFVAMGGVGLAASQLPKNSVGARHIKTNAVRAAEIRDEAVRSKEIADGGVAAVDVLNESLGGADIEDESIGGAEILDGSVRSSEVEDSALTGSDIQEESLGTGDISGLTGGDVQSGTFLGGSVTVQHQVAATPLADNSSAQYDVFCPASEIAIAGGARGDFNDSEYTIITSSHPLQAGGGFPVDGQTFTGWRATVFNPSGDPPTFPPPPGGDILPEVWVVCADQPS
jgi:hypothetical protein